MTKNDQIFKLFSECFKADNFLKQAKAKHFQCCHEKDGECCVDQDREPIWSARVGDDNTNIMIVAEAPSIEGGPGPNIGGNFDDIDKEVNRKVSPIYILKPFVKENYNNTIPYFTNLIKCGVTRQNSADKKILKKRAEFCFRRFLLQEIRIIQPETILCVGSLPYSFLKKCKLDGTIKGIDIYPLIHYGRQAGLPLSPEDKKNIIWKWQIGSPSKKQEIAQRLSELSYFQKNKPI